ncbi:hypothetical protein NLM33_36980 [Bradyrhizobium sp. CCGUVB1N3]|nr:hypothetical protein [Bradyrhizobium sp. CCGUVB1N3]MCP3475844.1 hypothetical protein [Bradyrhizobium sp. CCGUVB1N3]
MKVGGSNAVKIREISSSAVGANHAKALCTVLRRHDFEMIDANANFVLVLRVSLQQSCQMKRIDVIDALACPIAVEHLLKEIGCCCLGWKIDCGKVN